MHLTKDEERGARGEDVDESLATSCIFIDHILSLTVFHMITINLVPLRPPSKPFEKKRSVPKSIGAAVKDSHYAIDSTHEGLPQCAMNQVMSRGCEVFTAQCSWVVQTQESSEWALQRTKPRSLDLVEKHRLRPISREALNVDFLKKGCPRNRVGIND